MIDIPYNPALNTTYTGQNTAVDCGSLAESIKASWNVDLKIQIVILIIAIISFYVMISHSFAIIRLMKNQDEEVRRYIKKSLFYLAGYSIIWMLSLWLVFVFNLF